MNIKKGMKLKCTLDKDTGEILTVRDNKVYTEWKDEGIVIYDLDEFKDLTSDDPIIIIKR